ncbi:bidirectional sugar transporter SWEET10-like [Rutidosis leptorrhynchoides]|uniref:bidirectional sugar transporter SWEET10-like n=1 Tax=Rutidosis leptorrhynchoides TaxID=125765 RepID=UPI003A99DA2B
MEAWTFAFGILGNVISFMVGLAPLPTFYQIYKKKTAQGFQSVPYVVALFSAMLWMYYALVKQHEFLLITINSFFCVIETVYLGIYFYYAPKKERIILVKLFLLFNVFGFGTICLVTMFLGKVETRLRVLGYICMAFALSVFAAPLCIVKKVIQTKSVEFMSFSLSLCLTFNAVAWFCYGLSLKDWNIAVPNTLGFLFGIIQMVLYMMYRNSKKVVLETMEPKILNQDEHIVDVTKLSAIEINLVIPERNNSTEALLVEDQLAHVKELQIITEADLIQASTPKL